MIPQTIWLISGQQGSGITGSYFPVNEMSRFSFALYGDLMGTNAPTGTLSVFTKLDDSSSGIPIITSTFNNVSGQLFQVDGFLKGIYGAVQSYTTGTFHIVCLAGKEQR